MCLIERVPRVEHIVVGICHRPKIVTCPERRKMYSCGLSALPDLRFLPRRWWPPGSGAPGQVLDQKQLALACADDIRIAIAIDVLDRNLHAAAHASAVIDEVADPLDSSLF